MNNNRKVHFKLGSKSACFKTHSSLKFTKYPDEVTCTLCKVWMKKQGNLYTPWYIKVFRLIKKFFIGVIN